MYSCEAESVRASSTVCKAIWLRNLLKELDQPQGKPNVIYVDNKSVIKGTENPVQLERSKLMDIRFHFLRHHVKQKIVEPEYCPAQEQAVDIFTKLSPTDAFILLRELLSVTNF